jgi:hypothetical protein
MKSFIEDYLDNPTTAIARAAESMTGKWYDNVDEEQIYAQLSTPQYRLYESIVLSPSEPEFQRLSAFI